MKKKPICIIEYADMKPWLRKDATAAVSTGEREVCPKACCCPTPFLRVLHSALSVTPNKISLRDGVEVGSFEKALGH